MDSVRLEILGRVARYLAGDVDLRDLDRWLVPHTWEIERWAPENADLARTIQLLIEEFSHGDWTEEELKSHLRGVLGVIGTYEPTSVSTGSSSLVIEHDLLFSFAPTVVTAGTRHAGRRVETASA